MKNEIYVLIFFISAFLFGCNYHWKNTAQQSADNYKLNKNPEQCFVAVYQKDTAFLTYKTMPDGKIKGRLIIKYGELEPLALEKEFYHGEIKGRFTKDTLFADYIFADSAKRAIYRNPVALLRKSGHLMLGFGVTVNYLGSTWFRDHKAINFTRCRFQFVPVKCSN